MSTRTALRPQVVCPNAQASPTTGSMASNITTAPTILQSMKKASYGFSWAGTSPVGTVSIQCSNDYSLNANGTGNNAGTWNTLPFTSSSGALVTSFPVSGNSGNGFLELTTSAYALRAVYTAGSGTGTLTATITAGVS